MVGGFIDNGAVDAIALRSGNVVVSYGELRNSVAQRRHDLHLADRSVVVVVATPTIEFVVTYLALLADGHVPLLAGPQHERLVERWQPAAVIETGRNGWTIDHRPGGRSGQAHAAGQADSIERQLHPDLGLLLSTSGTSGGPKLVRLSTANLIANATSIVEYLSLSASDVAVTTLPLNYCYGLSVLHSHLLAGASIVLTDASVVDPGFVPMLHQHGVTNIAGVPHTFELLERSATSDVFVPSLRFVTQAGGRMAPERVRAWLDRCEPRGVSLFVMYGQTEATARMAFVPPARLREHPSTIGIPIPGGAIDVRIGAGEGVVDRACAAGEVGELVYRGPNVMMGYAEHPSDLALGATLAELRTGDLGRRLENGLLEVVGRRSRFIKPVGLRIDLDDLERRIVSDDAAGLLDGVVVTGDDNGVVVGAVLEGIGDDVDLFRAAGADGLVTAAARFTSLPPAMIDVVVLHEIPRTDRGKVDPASILQASRRWEDRTAGDQPGTAEARVRSLQAARRMQPASSGSSPPRREGIDPDAGSAAAVAQLYSRILGVVNVAPADTFVSLGGDSLSYVECSIRLEDLLGELPADWHIRAVGSFGAPVERTWHKSVDTTVVLRAVAILTVVAGHMLLTPAMGGAHLVLAVAGYNISRFVVDVEPSRRRWRAAGRAIARIALPTMAWVAAGMVFFDYYSWQNLLLVNDFLGPAEHLDGQWDFWFIEVLVQLTVLLMVGLWVPFLRAWERRWPYAFVLGLTVASMVFRIEQMQFGGWFNTILRPHGAALVFLLGWLVHRSNTSMTRAATTALAIVAMAGYFREPRRDLFVLAGLVLLVWVRDVRVPRVFVRPIALLAAASLSIYITHYAVYPVAEDRLASWPAFVTTVAAGVVAWWVASRTSRWVMRAISGQRGGGDPSGSGAGTWRRDEFAPL